MKKILLLLLIFINVGYANTHIVGGYGFSTIETPDIGSNDIAAQNLFAGIENHYVINETDTLLISGLYSTNRRANISYLHELELQIGFQKLFLPRHSAAVGFHLTHLLSENIDDVNFAGAGFGLNLAYKFQYSPMVAFNVQFHSNTYRVAADDVDRINVQSFRTFVSVYH
jgi:hypothetical protein